MNATKTYQLLFVLTILFLSSPSIMAQNSSAPIDREFSGETRASTLERNEEARPFLGVFLTDHETIDVSGEGTRAQKMEGVKVDGVIPNTSAEKAGLKEGDVIVKINGMATNTMESLTAELKKLKVNGGATIDYMRDGSLQTTSTILMAYNEETVLAYKKQKYGENASNGYGHHNMHKQNRCSSKAKETNSNKALLGVYAVAMDASIAEENDIRKVEGLYLKKVIEDSAADEAGLQQGDVLLSVNKVEVYSHQDLVKQLANFEAGDVVDLRFRRDNKAEKARATLKANKQENHKSWSNCHNKSSCTKSNTNTTTRTTVDGEERVFIHEVEIEDMEGNRTWVKVMMMDAAKEENVMLNDALKKEGKVAANKQVTEKMSNLNLQDLTFSPNPNRGQFSLSFDMPERGNTLVRIADTAGKVVFEENLGDFEGAYNQKIDISENYKGLYFLQVIQDDKVMTKKIVVQ
ncbi:MAG: PDZ domain-containing protein [Chitinophagales bacterium]